MTMEHTLRLPADGYPAPTPASPPESHSLSDAHQPVAPVPADQGGIYCPGCNKYKGAVLEGEKKLRLSCGDILRFPFTFVCVCGALVKWKLWEKENSKRAIAWRRMRRFAREVS